MPICLICTTGVVAGLELAQRFGFDEIIIGLWLGAVIFSVASWLINWLGKKKINFWQRNFWAISICYIITLMPLYFYKIIGDNPKLWGVDKVLLGVFVGSIIFAGSLGLIKFFKFPFRKVIIPLSIMLGVTIIFYFIF